MYATVKDPGSPGRLLHGNPQGSRLGRHVVCKALGSLVQGQDCLLESWTVWLPLPPYAAPRPVVVAAVAVPSLAAAQHQEFGASWCPHCQAIQPCLEAMLAGYPEVEHISVEDGRGKPLGRSFGVKLWPTLVFLRDGLDHDHGGGW